MYYFVSDIHLGAGSKTERENTERRFVEWLDAVSADAGKIFILGDLFDFWFEYRNVVPKGFVRTLARLAEMTDRGVEIVLLTGNHDMWVRDYLKSECGIEIFTSPLETELCGRKMLLAHGDNMNVERSKIGLRIMNAVFRSRVLRFLFSWLVHPDLALSFGKWWSGSSRKTHGVQGPECTEPLIEYARKYAAEHPGVDTFIFGHMHLMRDCSEGDMRTIFLGCWQNEPSCAAMDGDGNITLKRI